VDRDTAVEPERLAEDLLEEVAKPEIWLQLAGAEPSVRWESYAVDGASHRFGAIYRTVP
jgi:hypothetical protein